MIKFAHLPHIMQGASLIDCSLWIRLVTTSNTAGPSGTLGACKHREPAHTCCSACCSAMWWTPVIAAPVIMMSIRFCAQHKETCDCTRDFASVANIMHAHSRVGSFHAHLVHHKHNDHSPAAIYRCICNTVIPVCVLHTYPTCNRH